MATKQPQICETCGGSGGAGPAGVVLPCKGCAIVDKYEREHPNWADDDDGPTLEQIRLENEKRRLLEMRMDAYKNYIRPA